MPTRGEIPQPVENEVIVPLVDQVQTGLETSYGLPTKLRVASFLYPQAQSAFIPAKLTTGELNGLFATDLDFLPPAERMIRNPTVPKVVGKFGINIRSFVPGSFQSLNPALYFNDKIKAQLAGKSSLGDIDDKNEALQVLIEEISHFMFSNHQFDSQRRLPSYTMVEAVAPLDIYRIYRLICKERGIPMDSAKNPLIRKVEENIRIITQKRRNDWSSAKLAVQRKFASLAPQYRPMYQATATMMITEANRYVRSVDIIEGFVKYTMDLEKAGEDTSAIVGQFYTMSLREQLDYLKKLYETMTNPKYLRLLNQTIQEGTELSL